MFPDWIIYIILIIITILLAKYYKHLSNQKLFLENFNPKFQNNTLLKSYDIYNNSYQNTVDKNNNLENRLANNNYGSYYNTLYTNFSNLYDATGRLADNINRRSFNLTNNINNFKNRLANDANFINNNKNNILNKYTNIVNRNLTINNTPTIPGGFTTTNLNGNPGNMVQYRNGYNNTIFIFNVLGSINGGAVWGTDIYTDDSTISVAAVHAGVLTNGQSGNVYIQMLGARSSFSGTSRNGVQTWNYGSWPGSYQFLRSDNNINTTINNTINRQLEPSVSAYISGIPGNQDINNRITNKYNQGISSTTAQINGMNITFQQTLQQNINNALNTKKQSMSFLDISNNNGIIVRIFNITRTIPIDSICDTRLQPNNECISMFGPWISIPGPVDNISRNINGEKVYIKLDGGYTKMVSSSNQGRYYSGPISQYRPCNWNQYQIAPPGVYNVQTIQGCTTQPNPNNQIILNNFGTLEREYIVPSINYYMTSRIDPLFSTNINRNRVLEFGGNILIPPNTNRIEFQLETASGSRLYFNKLIVIDFFFPNTPVNQNTTAINVTPNNKFTFRLLSYEGVDNSNNYIMLKWRMNGQGNFVPVPIENYFLPNLSEF